MDPGAFKADYPLLCVSGVGACLCSRPPPASPAGCTQSLGTEPSVTSLTGSSHTLRRQSTLTPENSLLQRVIIPFPVGPPVYAPSEGQHRGLFPRATLLMFEGSFSNASPMILGACPVPSPLQWPPGEGLIPDLPDFSKGDH